MASTSNEKEDYGSILCLLHAKVHGEPLPNETPLVVHECDLYGKKNPWEIWESFGGGKDGSNGLYLFTIIRINMNSGDVFRTIGSGSWQDQHNDVAIVCKDTNQQLAVKKCLLFDKSGTSHDGAWILHEYCLVSFDFLGTSSAANFSYVLCKLMKNEGNRVQMRVPDERIARQEHINKPRASQSTTRLSQGAIAAAFNNNNNGGLRPITISKIMQLQVKGVLMRGSRWNNGTAEEEEERHHQR